MIRETPPAQKEAAIVTRIKVSRHSEPKVYELHAAAPVKPVAAKPGDKHAVLAEACGHDKKCICINKAIFIHDSAFATQGVGARALNPCNMRRPGSWTPEGIAGTTKGSVGKFLVFDTLEHGIHACVQTYQRFYANVGPRALVASWTNGGGKGDYQSAVNNCYL